MAKIIRFTHRKDVSFGVLVIIFTIVFFLADQLFRSNNSHPDYLLSLYTGKFLVSTVVIVMVLILWEEILFNVHIKPVDDGYIFRNHGTKLKFQVMIYLFIPAIIVFLYINYEVSAFRFFSWAVVCLALPVAGKLVSGIKNYNDYLKLTGSLIEFKNNQLQGTFTLQEILHINLIKDEGHALHKLLLATGSGDSITIDLDEMELENYYETINRYIVDHYSHLIK